MKKLVLVLVAVLAFVGCETEREKSDKLFDSVSKAIKYQKHYACDTHQKLTLIEKGCLKTEAEQMKVDAIRELCAKNIAEKMDDKTLELITIDELLKTQLNLYSQANSDIRVIQRAINERELDVKKQAILDKRK